MNGAESLLATAAAGGVDLCLANPGTTEMPLVAALDASPEIRAVLGLFEGVCTGAADGYGRMTGRPALTLLHLGPGFANGIANLHNARRARTPVVNLIGDHARWHLAADAPLTSDIASLARPVGGVRTADSAPDLPKQMAEALAEALGPPAGVVSLIVPADCQWEEASGPLPPAPRPTLPEPEQEAVARSAEALRAGGALVLGGPSALGKAGLTSAARIRAAGVPVWVETFTARIERGTGLPDLPRIPYFPEQAREALARARCLVLAGAPEPVAFFGYRGQPSRLLREDQPALQLAGPGEDAAAGLAALADRLAAPDAPLSSPARPEAGRGPLTAASLGQTLAARQPEGAIVVDEAATTGGPWTAFSAAAPPHTVLGLTGGAIGQGLPCATGAALACPERPVIALQADGSALYTLQALWTQARENLHVVSVICANRRYRILQVELARAGIAEPGPKARSLTSLDVPAVDWVSAARAFGVPALRCESAEELDRALQRALASPGPSLIEAVLD